MRILNLSLNYNNNSDLQNNSVSFQARVDKGLERFYEFNKHRMPARVSNFINGLADKTQV